MRRPAREKAGGGGVGTPRALREGAIIPRGGALRRAPAARGGRAGARRRAAGVGGFARNTRGVPSIPTGPRSNRYPSTGERGPGDGHGGAGTCAAPVQYPRPAAGHTAPVLVAEGVRAVSPGPMEPPPMPAKARRRPQSAGRGGVRSSGSSREESLRCPGGETLVARGRSCDGGWGARRSWWSRLFGG